VTRLLLALDTSTEVTSVGLARVEDGVVRLLGGVVEDAPRAALSRVLPMAEAMLAEAGFSASDLDGVVVGRGPGSFTGVRIGVAAAKGLAHGLGVPLWGVGTLDAIAQPYADESVLLAVIGDAMRGEVYPALFRCGGGRAERLAQDRVSKPAVVAAEWDALGEELLLVGNGIRKYEAVFAEALGDRASFAERERWAPSPVGLFAAWAVASTEGTLGDGDPATVLPVYTRLSDAEEAERERAGLPWVGALDTGVAGTSPAQEIRLGGGEPS